MTVAAISFVYAVVTVVLLDPSPLTAGPSPLLLWLTAVVAGLNAVGLATWSLVARRRRRSTGPVFAVLTVSMIGFAAALALGVLTSTDVGTDGRDGSLVSALLPFLVHLMLVLACTAVLYPGRPRRC